MDEQSAYARPESIVTAWSIASLLLEVGAEHVSAFVKTITEPVEAIASWTCVRSMLESCALAAWVVDPAIDAETRVKRTFAYRYEGLEQQIKFANAAALDASEIAKARNQMDKLESDAQSLGFLVLRDRNGKRIGVAIPMPSATELIGKVLDHEKMYRILSAVAHGHSWAITQLGFKQSAVSSLGGVPTQGLEKQISFLGMAMLSLCTATSFARPLWSQCRYFGWDKDRLEELFENVADRMQINLGPRFWRDNALPTSVSP
jgi:hypothetical protein